VTLNWGFTGCLDPIGKLKKPMLVADEYLGGSGVFLTGLSALARHGIATGAVSPTRLEDLAAVARTFADVKKPGITPENFLPEGYMTTSFRTSVGRKKLVLHQAKAVGNLDADRGCRTHLLGDVRGDIQKLFYQWDLFGWHRVTVYGDLREPLLEFAKALGLEVVEEA